MTQAGARPRCVWGLRVAIDYRDHNPGQHLIHVNAGRRQSRFFAHPNENARPTGRQEGSAGWQPNR